MRPPKLLVVILAVGGLAIAAVAAVGAVGGDRASRDEQRPPAADPYAGLGAEPGTDSVEGREPHPRGGAPWSVVVFRSKDGRTCAAAGRNVDGRVGAINEGRFSAYPIREGASCVNLDSVPAGAQITTNVGAEKNTVVHGIAGPDVAAIEISARGTTDEPAIGQRGGFVAVLPQDIAITELDVVARLTSGERVPLL